VHGEIRTLNKSGARTAKPGVMLASSRAGHAHGHARRCWILFVTNRDPPAVSKEFEHPGGCSYLFQLVEQRLCVLQVGGVEALGEPTIEVGQHRMRLVSAIGVAQKPREADGGAQLQ